ncbi:MAG TPA: ISKra4 family transposase [Candidatus Acidoferrales bacterium]|nr:ISKra4 family transposase [Candidatus Acidoferrales bacterium]
MSTTCCAKESGHGHNSVGTESLAVKAARLADALDEGIRAFLSAGEQNLGDLEMQIERESRELLRLAAEKGAQQKADAAPPVCPVCRQALSRVTDDHARSFECKFGSLTIQRSRGYCKRCRKWRFPADTVLGLAETAGYSPRVQEMAALLASKMPVSEASAVLEHLTGVKLPPATLDREARRQGERACQVRRQEDKRAGQVPSKAAQPELVLEPYQMIIQLDAWNIRERDEWGRTGALRKLGQEPERWHWVYTGTCFRLDQRGKTAGGRPVISERGFVATREGIDGLREQLHAEALRRGLGQAAGVLVIGDGAMWIWRLADDRFQEARQRLDFYHAVQHLAVVGRALYGEDQAKLKSWLRPLAHQLKHQSSVKVVARLEEILAQLPAGATAQAVEKEVNYFHEHKDRMDYRAARRRGEPIGSGAIESTCHQTQCRFKRPGQYWSRKGDEALLCLETFWRNGRWHLLFPHHRQVDLSKN